MPSLREQRIRRDLAHASVDELRCWLADAVRQLADPGTSPARRLAAMEQAAACRALLARRSALQRSPMPWGALPPLSLLPPDADLEAP